MKLEKVATCALVALVCLLIVLPEFAHATPVGGIVELEGPIDKLKNAFTGPIAMGISLIGLVVTGGMLIFGGELNEFARRSLFAVLVVALIVGAANIMTTVFGVNAAMI